jgi:DedD protein
MATPNITDEEIQFRKRARRRLVGAIVLVLIVVVVVPWILPADKPQQDTQQIDIRIPAQDASGYASKVQPAPAPVLIPAPTPAVQPQPDAALPITPPAAKVEAAEPPAKPADQAPAPLVKALPAAPETKPEAKAATKPAAAPLAAAASIYVQYGAFSEAKNAKQRQAELKAKGIATYTEVVKTSAGDRIRVRSGPYVTRDAAEKVRQKAKPLDSKLVVIGGKV